MRTAEFVLHREKTYDAAAKLWYNECVENAELLQAKYAAAIFVRD